MTREIFMRDYWTYYLMLEKKFIDTEAYVTLNSDNLPTYSNEYASLLQLIGAELDEIFKEYCNFALEEKKNICDYAKIILADEPSIRDQEIEVINSDLTIQPFKGWESEKAKQSLTWWEAFDKIKHNRLGNKSKASLKNVLDILGALFLIELKCLKRISIENHEPDIPNQESSLFILKGWQFEYMSGGDAFLKFVEMIED